MALTVEEVEAVLKLKDELSGKLDTIKGNVGGFSDTLKSMAGVAATAFAFKEVAAAAGQVLTLTGHIDDLSKKSGISAEAVQELDYAARLSGSSFDQVSGALAIMGKNLADPQKGAVGLFKAMGLSLTELQGMQPDKAFEAIGAAVAKIEDPMVRSKVAMELFGKSGTQLLPVLTGDIEGLRAKAHETGNVISNDLVARGDELGDSWETMQGKIKTMQAEALLPVLETFMKLPAPMQGILAAGVQFAPMIAAMGTAWVTLGSSLMGVIVPLFTTILPAAFSAILPFLGPIGAIAVAVGAVYLAWKHWDKITEIAKAVYDGIKTWLVDAFQGVVNNIKAKIDAIKGFFQGMYDFVVGHSVVPDMSKAVKAHFASMADESGKSTAKLAATVEAEAANMKRAWIGTLEEMRFAEIALQQQQLRDLTAWFETRRAAGRADILRWAQEQLEARDQAGQRFRDAELEDYKLRQDAAKEHWRIISQINNEIGLRQMEKDAQAMRGIWGTLKDSIGGSLSALNGIFQSAFEGGGGMGGAVKSFTTKILGDLLKMIPVVGPMLSQFAGAFVAMGQKIWGVLRGAFGGPSNEEKQGREVFANFVDGLKEGLQAGQVQEIQQAVASGWDESLATASIAIRDAFLATGRSAEEADAMTRRLFDATRISGTAVEAVIRDINVVMQEAQERATAATTTATTGFNDNTTAITETIDTLKGLTGPEYETLKARSIEILTLLHGLWTEVHNATLASRNAVLAVIDALGNLRSAINDIPREITIDVRFNVGDLDLPSGADTSIQSFATGGRVQKTGLALVHAGEMVVPAGESADTTFGGSRSSMHDDEVHQELVGLRRILERQGARLPFLLRDVSPAKS